MPRNFELSDLSPSMRAQALRELEPSRVAEALKVRKPRKSFELDLQSEVVEELQERGYMVLHIRPARTAGGWRTPIAADGVGYPDITAVHPLTGNVYVLELKSDDGTVADAQLVWLRAWRRVPGVTALIVRPSSWSDVRAIL